MPEFFISGIDTNVGKTLVSAIFTEALQADYWKPVQAGYEEGTDTNTVKSLVSNTTSFFHPEAYLLKNPVSPHYAAILENIELDEKKIIQQYKNMHRSGSLIIEGAGGLMVPINKRCLVLDLIQSIGIPVVLVVKNYLGSINHTLLSLQILKNKGIPVQGMVFSGIESAASKTFILEYSQVPCILDIPVLASIDPETVSFYATLLKSKFK